MGILEKLFDSNDYIFREKAVLTNITNELKVYRALRHLQGIAVPNFYGVVKTNPFIHHGHRSPGILLEYIGTNYLSLARWTSACAYHHQSNPQRCKGFLQCLNRLYRSRWILFIAMA